MCLCVSVSIATTYIAGNYLVLYLHQSVKANPHITTSVITQPKIPAKLSHTEHCTLLFSLTPMFPKLYDFMQTVTYIEPCLHQHHDTFLRSFLIDGHRHCLHKNVNYNTSNLVLLKDVGLQHC